MGRRDEKIFLRLLNNVTDIIIAANSTNKTSDLEPEEEESSTMTLLFLIFIILSFCNKYIII
jgi:hypothetical protein